MGIILRREDTTTVERVGYSIVITQYENDDLQNELGKVILSLDQFREMYNYEKYIMEAEE